MTLGKTVLRGAAGLALLVGVSVASPAAAGSVYAVSNGTNNNGTSHAFWLPPGDDDAAPGTHYHWVASSNPTLTFDGTSWANSATAVLRGQIQQATSGSPNSPIPGGSVFDVEMHFDSGQSLAAWTDPGNGGSYKNENGTSLADVMGWQIFRLNEAPGVLNRLTRVSGPGQAVIDLSIYKPNMLGFQVGIGASMKQPNDVLGASSWISYTDTVTDPTRGIQRRGDINIELAAATVPTPSAALGSLAMLGLLGCRRRRKV